MKLDREDQNTEVVVNAPQQPTRSRTRMKKAAPPPPSNKTEPITTNGSVLHGSPSPPPVVTTPEPGEDCAINELLEGNMDLEVVLPDKRKVCMTVERRTPMMDLLVQVTTANKIQPGGHVINLWPERRRDIGYKPNTPIGSLDTNVIYIVPKSVEKTSIKKMPKLPSQPFEQTFRLQVNLPRNQKTVLRVSQRSTLADVKQQICKEKELDSSHYHLVHPSQTDTVLDLNCTLSDYGWTEISLLSNSSLSDNIRTSNADFSNYSICDYATREEEKKKKGILRLFSRRKKNPNDSIRSTGVSPSRSELSLQRELSHRDSTLRKQSIKKRPAPPPPPSVADPLPTNGLETKSTSDSKTEGGSTVSHSRHSSDSSGYHEPSVFSEYSENKSPETSSGNDSSGICIAESPVNQTTSEIKIPSKKTSTPTKDSSKITNAPSCSNISVISNNKKRKAPPPPVQTEISKNEENQSTEDSESSDTVNGSLSLSPVDPQMIPSNNQMTINERDSSASQSTLEDSENTLIHTNPDISEDLPSTLASSPLDKISSEAKIEEVEHKILQDNHPDTSEEKRISIDSVEDLEITFREVIETLEAETKMEEKLDPSDNSAAVAETVLRTEEDCQTSVSSESNAVPSVEEWEYNIPDPPSPFRNEALQFEILNSEISDAEKLPDSCTTTCDTSPPPLPAQPPPLSVDVNKEILVNEEDTRETILASNETDSGTTQCITNEMKQSAVLPKARVNKLIKFTVGCYKSEEEDIYATQQTSQLNESNNKIKITTQQGNKSEEFLESTKKHSGSEENKDINAMPLKPRRGVASPSNHKDQSKETVDVKRDVFSKKPSVVVTVSPFNSTRSSSMVNLYADKEVDNKTDSLKIEEIVTPEHILKRTRSDQNLKDMPPAENVNLDQEQKRLYQEYYKLQGQFVAWQQQLIHNQALLQNKQILPQMNIPQFSPFNPPAAWNSSENSLHNVEKVNNMLPAELGPKLAGSNRVKPRVLPKPISRPSSLINLNSGQNGENILSPASETNSVPEDLAEARSQTLPRPKPRPISMLQEGKSSTLDRRSRPKTSVVAVSIGSWQQRNCQNNLVDSTSVASTRLKFKSLENVSLEKGSKAPFHNGLEDGRSKSQPLNDSATVSTKAKVIEDVRQETSGAENVYASGRQNTLSTKPIVRVSSMKTDFQLPSTNSNESGQHSGNKTEAASAAAIIAKIREDLKAEARHPAGTKSVDNSTATVHKEQCVKPSDLRKENTKNQESKAPPKQLHITKVNINNDIPKNKSQIPLHSSKPVEKTENLSISKLVKSGVLGTLNKKEASSEINGTSLATSPDKPTSSVPSVSPFVSKETESVGTSSLSPPPPPPPPPLPVLQTPNSNVAKAKLVPNSSQNFSKTSSDKPKEKGQKLNVPVLDPREELMIEIRRFGGRQALRQVPDNQTSWNLRVFGKQSSVSS